MGAGGEFVDRHIGPGEADVARMLREVGFESLQALIERVVPASILRESPPRLPEALSESAALARLRRLAGRNKVFRSFIGQGYHDTLTPAVIKRNVLENPGWYTAYTPYQAEISQGRLEMLFHFQTLVAELSGLSLANASLLDEATAAAEAMTLCRRAAAADAGDVFFVDAQCLPQTRQVLRTRARHLGIEVVFGDPLAGAPDGAFGALLQYPGVDGEVRDLAAPIAAMRARGAVVAMAADPLSLLLLKSPGELGADVAVGSMQRFGVPMGFGGPHAAYMAVGDAHMRLLPGRLVGRSIDAAGADAYRLALQTREQHIRRDKATSNICTAQTLPAVLATFYAMHHGAGGLRRIAEDIHRHAAIFAAGLERLGLQPAHRNFFDTVTVACDAEAARDRARARGVNLRRVDAGRVGVSFGETTAARADIETLWGIFAPDGAAAPDFEEVAAAAPRLPAALRRATPAPAAEVFAATPSETEMLRLIRRLADKDIALDRAMIPLGSCTMKLNATSEMTPIGWPEFCDVHPHAPEEQTRGWRRLIDELGGWLASITGYAAVSMQPNAGSQGEYAGLLAIRAYHASRGDHRRDVCLIPTSAHGTNPATASLCGMRIVSVDCDDDGNVSLRDLQAKAEACADELAAAMITYPSTHGVFEPEIRKLCRIVRKRGGLVYIDGANLNAMVGLCQLGKIGGDVSHLNLHKTFCIPHGGGGPGVGPVAVARRLAEFLPAPASGESPQAPVGPVSAASFGNAGVLPISWMYIQMMGAAGLRRATEVAILNANYIARRLGGRYPILYTGADGLVAHECIVDLRDLQGSAGVSAEDVAKRLIDYGFHAPTLAFPVAGTLMIEPTESESLAELDRFCDAMLAIREEIADIEKSGAAADNLLKNAPHTAEMLADDEWPHAYSRRQAVYPLPGVAQRKYWPPVRRVDSLHGDRALLAAHARSRAGGGARAGGEEFKGDY